MQAFKKQMFQINMKCWQENPNWQEADQLAIYTVQLRSWTWGGGGGNWEQIQWVAGWRTWIQDRQISIAVP